ncbi:60S ribosomal protein L24 [Ascosphaera atra]|nr:60S ribosomal protein L24 [Ascosphaera atra]
MEVHLMLMVPLALRAYLCLVRADYVETFGCIVSVALVYYHYLTTRHLKKLHDDYSLVIWANIMANEKKKELAGIWPINGDMQRKATEGIERRWKVAERQEKVAFYASLMRTYDDAFSGAKIYPGKGKIYVRGDSKIFRFANGKSESLFLQRKNPRRIAWTVLFRKQHKKGISEEVAKKRTRRHVKSQRAVVGASLDVIKERRSQRPEARLAARQAAIKEGKAKKAEAEKKKKAEKARLATQTGAGKKTGKK